MLNAFNNQNKAYTNATNQIKGINFLSTNNWHIGHPNRQVQWKGRDETRQSIETYYCTICVILIVWYNLLIV